jgi:hypothetical protein
MEITIKTVPEGGWIHHHKSTLERLEKDWKTGCEFQENSKIHWVKLSRMLDI